MPTFANDWLLHEPGARDFASAYLSQREATQEATIAGMASIPGFRRVVESRTRADSEAGYAAYWHGVERAFAGDWEARAVTLHHTGTTIGRAGATIQDWQDLAELTSDLVRAELFARHGAEPERLQPALRVMQQFIDRSFHVFTTAYVTANQEQLRQLDALQARAVELESENRQVRAASRTKSEFLANMSHELRTPLNSILGFSELLKGGEVGPLQAQQLEFIEDIHSSGQHLLRLLNDILDLSKVEAGRLEFSPKDLDLQDATREIVQSLRAMAVGHTFDIVIDPSVRRARLDPVRYKQVLYNYLSNAIKHGRPLGRVAIRVQAENADTFRLEVQDDGAGIPAEQLSRLFLVFEQLGGGDRTKPQTGTGLGLALTRRLVEAQGGVVGVVSQVGKGSTFHAILPRFATGTASLPAPRTIGGAREESARVLVIDSDRHDQDRTVATLLASGYAVDTVASGAQAIRTAQEHRYAAFTIGSSTTELLTQLRLVPELSALPVAVIPKPLEPNQLLSVLSALPRA